MYPQKLFHPVVDCDRLKMSLAEHARRVAAEFDYPAEHAIKGVREFIREMG